MNRLQSALFAAAGLGVCVALAPAGRSAPPVKAARRSVTFAKDVAPILYDKCARCHHAGEVAPFSLVTYEDAKGKAKTIAAVVSQKFMPPWQAHSHGEFANERTLTDGQITTLRIGRTKAPRKAIRPPSPQHQNSRQIGNSAPRTSSASRQRATH